MVIVPFPCPLPANVLKLHQSAGFWIGRAKVRLEFAERCFESGDRHGGLANLESALKFIEVARYVAEGGKLIPRRDQ